MKKHEVVVTDKAYSQLKAAAQWWAENRSVEQAEKWFAGFLEAIVSLEKNPGRCPLARENTSFPVEIRELHYGVSRRATHRAIFVIRPDKVVVYSVRHLAQRDIQPEDL